MEPLIWLAFVMRDTVRAIRGVRTRSSKRTRASEKLAPQSMSRFILLIS